MAELIRAALERLVSAYDSYDYDSNEGLPIAEWIAAARAALDNSDESAVPATPADGEVAELVAKLRRLAPQNPLGTADPTITRTAELLQQQQGRIAELEAEQMRLKPVPVAADVYFEFAVSDADYCTQAGGIAPTYAQALDEGQRYLAQYQQDGVHTLELRRVEVLPIPQEES